MGQNSSLKNKLDQHQFDYRPGAWESMESLLDASLPIPNVPKSSKLFTKWFRWLGAAALVSVIAFLGFNSFNPQKDVVKTPIKPTEQVIDNQVNTPENETAVSTNQIEKKSNSAKNNGKIENNNFSSKNVVTPNEYQTISPTIQSKKSVQHAEPVDDSKVYRENNNHKKPHQHIDEQGKAPAASDLHHN